MTQSALCYYLIMLASQARKYNAPAEAESGDGDSTGAAAAGVIVSGPPTGAAGVPISSSSCEAALLGRKSAAPACAGGGVLVSINGDDGADPADGPGVQAASWRV